MHRLLPRLLLPIMPQLGSQLHGEDGKARAAAVKLLGSIFGQPNQDLALQYPDLLSGVLTRLKDAQVRS